MNDFEGHGTEAFHKAMIILHGLLPLSEFLAMYMHTQDQICPLCRGGSLNESETRYRYKTHGRHEGSLVGVLSIRLLQIHPNKLHNLYLFHIYLLHASFCTGQWEGSVQYRSPALGFGTVEKDYHHCPHLNVYFGLGFWTRLSVEMHSNVDVVSGGNLIPERCYR